MQFTYKYCSNENVYTHDCEGPSEASSMFRQYKQHMKQTCDLERESHLVEISVVDTTDGKVMESYTSKCYHDRPF